MSVAREVLTDLVGQLPDGVQANLIAYGHREKDDCDDIEQLVELQPIEHEAFIDAVGKVEPKGQTPLTAATRQAIEMAKAQGAPATVVRAPPGQRVHSRPTCAVVTHQVPGLSQRLLAVPDAVPPSWAWRKLDRPPPRGWLKGRGCD